jgi:DNA-binding NtrC family response regulator
MKLLDNKRILIVDDEPDVLDILAELLPMCELTKAASFKEAKELLETQTFDLAILDIMGVEGYELLEIAINHDITAAMLTAYVVSPENVVKSYKKGAATFIPKEEMANITVYLNDILEAKERGKSYWWRWLDRLGDYFDKRFGPDWKTEDKAFWENLKYHDPTL